jgi:hypothetical protein
LLPEPDASHYSREHICPDEALIFVVDRPTEEGPEDAEAEFVEASEKSGAFVVWSTECS